MLSSMQRVSFGRPHGKSYPSRSRRPVGIIWWVNSLRLYRLGWYQNCPQNGRRNGVCLLGLQPCGRLSAAASLAWMTLISSERFLPPEASLLLLNFFRRLPLFSAALFDRLPAALLGQARSRVFLSQQIGPGHLPDTVIKHIE